MEYITKLPTSCYIAAKRVKTNNLVQYMDRNALDIVHHALQSCRNMFETPAAHLLNSFNETYILCHTQNFVFER